MLNSCCISIYATCTLSIMSDWILVIIYCNLRNYTGSHIHISDFNRSFAVEASRFLIFRAPSTDYATFIMYYT